MNVQWLPCVSDECPLKDHLLSNNIVLTSQTQSPYRPEWVCRGFTASSMNSHFKTTIWIQIHWLIEFCLMPYALSSGSPKQMCICLPCVSDECPLQDHFLIKPIALTWYILSPGRPEWTCWSFPMSVINAVYKTIFQVSLSYWLNGLFLPEARNNECKEVSFVSPMNGLLKTIFWVKLCIQRLCVQGDLYNEHVESLPVSLRKSLSRTIFWVILWQWLNETVSLRRPEQLCRFLILLV